ncbi:MAG TPA: DegT/DnrJ/EryC1/StrS family aminotransferase, partial [bacterium]|nr:DegT/DnrJ/EryC1/StrS family aminotransferase [bacterium]
SSCTAGLHLLVQALGLGSGDEVIVPSMTFVATVNAVLYVGAKPVFVDIAGVKEPHLDPKSVEAAVTPRTRAIMVMHYGGHPAPMAEYKSVAERHGLALLEDAAHAPGARVKGEAIGSLSAGAAFSFYANKNLSTGEGGMITTNDAVIADLVRSSRSHGMTSTSWERHSGRTADYDVERLGYNYRMTEITAALGRVQLRKLPQANQARARLDSQYRERLGELPQIEIPYSADSSGSVHHLFPIVLSSGISRDRFRERLAQQGIQTSIHYRAVHQMSYHKRLRKAGKRVALPITEEYASREVTLPLFPSMTEAQLDAVVQAVRTAVLEA